MRAAPGAGPAVRLLVYAASFAVGGYALAQIARGGHAIEFALWFGGAALLHDLVLLPLYSAADRLIRLPGRVVCLLRGGERRRSARYVNHVRVPALISGLLLVVYAPLILGLSRQSYLAASGHEPRGYLRNWLEVSACLFAGSALVYAARRVRSR